MLNILLKFVFTTITKLAGIIISPLLDGFVSLIPSLSTGIPLVLSFTAQIFNYIPLALDLMLIPRPLVLVFFDYLLVKYTIYLYRKLFNFVMVIYQKFKP